MAACGIAPEDDDGNAASKPVPALSAAAIKKDAFDELEPDEKIWISDLAQSIKTMVERGELRDAVDDIDAAIPQEGERRIPKAVEYKLALWSQLDSKTRSALTKYRESLKQPKAE